MERGGGGQTQRWFEGASDQQPSVRSGPSAVNVISITRRPEGGIVNVEVRRQEGSGLEPTASRESSPRNVIFAKTPPLPFDTRFRGFGGIAVHSTETGRLHRALADHVRALHGQSLFDRFNEPAPSLLDSHHLSHSSSSLASGRRVHTIPIRVEGRSRPASCPPTTAPQHQRVYEIPVNVVSSPGKEKASTAAIPSDQSAKYDVRRSAQTMSLPSRIQFDASNDAERKLASLMSQLETEMNSSATAPVQKQLSEISLTPVSVSTATKAPPPYHGPHITEFFARPPHLPEGTMSPTKQAAGFVSVAEPGSPSPGTPVRTVAVDAEPLSQVTGSAEHYGEFTSLCL